MNRKLLFKVICLILFVGALFLLKEGLKPTSKIRVTKEIEIAVGEAIKSKYNSYAAGEIATEGHIILEAEEKDGKVKVYTISSLGVFGFEDGIFTIVSGSGAIPTVMTFSKVNDGNYNLLEYKEPQDGSYYGKSIKEMFPRILWNEVSSAHERYDTLEQQKEVQAEEYLRSIGRRAEVRASYVEKKLADIDERASNKLMEELYKFDSFISNCPYWLGTREQIEDGTRYIYERSQDKAEDGKHIIIFRKRTEDGSVIDERKYKIVEGEPMLMN